MKNVEQVETSIDNQKLNEKLKCKECGQEFTKIDCVTRHVKIVHKIEPQAYYDKWFKKENEGKCKCCGNETKYWSLEHGYREFCSRKCFWKVTTQLESVKEKRKQTCKEKYDSENYMQCKDFKEKSENTCIKKYNIKNGGGSKEAIAKIKATKLEKYNNENYNNSEKKELCTLKKFANLCKDIEILSYKNKIFLCRCKKCGTEFEIPYQTLCNRLFIFKTDICTNCNPIMEYDSGLEKELTNYVKSIILKVVENDRTVLNGDELDIYVPEKKIAFEFDGLYWHNELYKQDTYHLKKTMACEALGIQLIHIFEDEWLLKQDIVKSRIRGFFNQNEKIYARKCNVRLVPYKEAKVFLEKNHIQGNCMSSDRYGLYYNDELVSLMTFGKSRFNNDIELLRFCNRLYTNVIGGASKLFKHYLNDKPEVKRVISFADRRWSTGNLYDKLGFVKDSITPPSYFYVINRIRHNRIEFQKHKLVEQGFDSNMTEHEIMLSRGIYRIYDCGNLKYIFER